MESTLYIPEVPWWYGSNFVSLNSFIDNTVQAHTSYERFDLNYWSDYEGEDLDGDGIGDTNLPHFGDNAPLMSPWIWPFVSATLDVDPDTLSLRNRAEEITAYIELSEDFNVNDIDVASTFVSAIGWDVTLIEPRPTEVGDYDNDGTPDLMVKFNKYEGWFLAAIGLLAPESIYDYYRWGMRRSPLSFPINRYDIGMYNLLHRYDETGEVTITVIGQLSNGTFFVGNNATKIIIGW